MWITSILLGDFIVLVKSPLHSFSWDIYAWTICPHSGKSLYLLSPLRREFKSFVPRLKTFSPFQKKRLHSRLLSSRMNV